MTEIPCLSKALPVLSTRNEKNVVVLSDDELEKLEELSDTDSTVISARSKAILRLGIDLGMRRIDIVNLTIDKINWQKQTILIMQKKTQYEIELAMPTKTANALYQYIMTERPDHCDPHIFLTSNAPFRPLGPQVCRAVIKEALPERNSGGFHILRKTFASKALNNGAELDEVILLLGHRDMSNVHKYLSLDVKCMKQCPISLQEYSIGGDFVWQ